MSEKKYLTIISSKDPGNSLLECVDGIIKYYPMFDIVIIDSDSENMEMYKKIIHSKVKIHFLKNKYYEFGARKLGYYLYPEYDIYICIQDSIIPTEKMSLDKFNSDNIGIFSPNDYGFAPHSDFIAKYAEKLVEGTIYYKYFMENCNKNFLIATHTSFIVGNSTLKYILDTLPNLGVPWDDDLKAKLGPYPQKPFSEATERILGLVFGYIRGKQVYDSPIGEEWEDDRFIYNGKEIFFMHNYFKKIHLSRS